MIGDSESVVAKEYKPSVFKSQINPFSYITHTNKEIAMNMNLGEEYVKLGFRINKHVTGFVDAFFGPPEIKTSIEKEEPESLEKLRASAEKLLEYAESSSCDNPNRLFLSKQIKAMQLIIRQEMGEKIPFEEYVRSTLDIEPIQNYDEIIDLEQDSIGHLLDIGKYGKGKSIADRLNNFNQAEAISDKEIGQVIENAVIDCRNRALKIVSIPTGEHVEFKFVSNAPWGEAYNWYLGNYQSKVEINVDFPRTKYDLYGLVTHEAYPGHHTELSNKEKMYRETGMVEYTVVLLNTPMNVVSEGLADVAYDIIFGDQIPVDWQLSRALVRLRAACLSKGALLKHVNQKSDESVKKYLIDNAFFSDSKATAYVEFINYPLFRGYVMTYFAGQKHMRDYLFNMRQDNDVTSLLNRLMNQLNAPSML